MKIRETGLENFREEQAEPSSQPASAPEKDKSEPIKIAEGNGGIVEGHGAERIPMTISDEKPDGFIDPDNAITAAKPENAVQRAERLRHEEIEAKKKAFIEKVMEARREREAPPPKPQPMSPHIQKQTLAEVDAGRRAAADHAARRGQELVQGKSRAADPKEGTMTPVLRPQSYTHERNVAKTTPVS